MIPRKGDAMERRFRVEKEGNIAWLILDRAGKNNTMTREFFSELQYHLIPESADVLPMFWRRT